MGSVKLEALAYLTRCQPQEGYGYRPVERVYLLQVGAAAGGTAGRVSLLGGPSSGCLFAMSFYVRPLYSGFSVGGFLVFIFLLDAALICGLVD